MKSPNSAQSRAAAQRPRTTKVIILLYKPSDPSGDTLVLKRSHLTVPQIARICKCSVYIVRRIMKAFEEGGLDGVGAIRWYGGNRYKEKLSTNEVEWLVNPDTLKLQAHMNLEQRAKAFNLKFDKKIFVHDIRALYRGVGISK